MKMRNVVVVLLLLCAAGRVAAQGPAKADSNQRMIEKAAKGILAMAHPTVMFTGATYQQTKSFADGSYAQTFRFTWQNAFNDSCYRYWHFHYSKEGTIDQIEDGDTDTIFPPFAANNTLLNAIKDNIRDQIRTGKLNQNDPVANLILDVPEMRRATVLLLRLGQK